MIGRREREGPLMRNATHSLRKSRIVTAVVIGVLIGCILAFFFPNGFFVAVHGVSGLDAAENLFSPGNSVGGFLHGGSALLLR